MAAARGEPSRQSLLSRQLKELEEALGFKLLNRESIPYQLTDNGREVEKLVRVFLQDLDNLVAAKNKQGPMLTIGAGESLIQWFLIPTLARCFEQTGISLKFRNQTGREVVESLRSGKIDLGVVSKRHVGTGFVSQTLAKYGVIAVGILPELEKRRVLEWKDFCEKGVVLLEGQGRLREQIESVSKEVGKEPQVVFECSSYVQVLEACRQNGLVGVVPEIARNSAKALGLSIWKLKELDVYRIETVLVRRKDSKDNEMVTKVMELME